MPTVFNKISAGFALGATDPITAGIEDVIYVWNKGDVTFTYDVTNPLLITGIAAVAAAKIFKFTGTNNSFNSVSKMVKSAVGPRYTEEVDFNIAGLSSAIKLQLMALGYGRAQCATVNNWKTGDSAIELWGATNGLVITEADRTAADESMEGGYKLKLSNPDKIREPYPPRVVYLTSYAISLAILDALV